LTIDRDFLDADDGCAESDAPPVPPRTTSWNLGGPFAPPGQPELHIPESPAATAVVAAAAAAAATGRRCHSPCVLVGRLCDSPSIVRKFEAMLQENEGKVLTGYATASCSAPANANCNVGCCHNRRSSCDLSKLHGGGGGDGSKPAPCATPVQKSFSEVNIVMAGKERSVAVGSPQISKDPKTVAAPEITPPSSSSSSSSSCPKLLAHGARRNVLLEQKTAECNRTLFQAEMGRGVSERDGAVPPDASLAGSGSAVARTRNASEGEVRLHRGTNLNPQPQSAGVTSDAAVAASIPKAAPAACGAPARDPPRPSQNPPEVRLRKTSRREARGQEVKVPREDPLPPELSLRHSLTSTFSEVSVVTTRTHSQHPEPEHRAGSAGDNPGCGVKRYCGVTGGGPMSPGLLLVSPGAARPGKPESPGHKVRTSEVRDGSSPRQPAGQTRPAAASGIDTVADADAGSGTPSGQAGRGELRPGVRRLPALPVQRPGDEARRRGGARDERPPLEAPDSGRLPAARGLPLQLRRGGAHPEELRRERGADQTEPGRVRPQPQPQAAAPAG